MKTNTNEDERVVLAVELNHPTLAVSRKCRVAAQPSSFHLANMVMAMTTMIATTTTTSMTMRRTIMMSPPLLPSTSSPPPRPEHSPRLSLTRWEVRRGGRGSQQAASPIQQPVLSWQIWRWPSRPTIELVHSLTHSLLLLYPVSSCTPVNQILKVVGIELFLCRWSNFNSSVSGDKEKKPFFAKSFLPVWICGGGGGGE